MVNSETSISAGTSTWLAGLGKTRNALGNFFSSLGYAPNSEGYLNDLHDALILCDVGFDASQNIIDKIRPKINRRSANHSELEYMLKHELSLALAGVEKRFNPDDHTSPAVMLMLGVNGVGKTTTVAKIANYYQQSGYSVVMAACDTYRPAAIEQLQVWGDRIKVPVIFQSSGADPAAVAHDAFHAATARNAGLLILDTAGRQHSRDDLMRQVEKVGRVLSKIEPTAPHETLITIDGATGQNAISQVEHFNRHIPLSGICISKLDGTAKGGILIALAQKFALPVRFIGLGESIEDIAPFQTQEYVNSLLPFDNHPV